MSQKRRRARLLIGVAAAVLSVGSASAEQPKQEEPERRDQQVPASPSSTAPPVGSATLERVALVQEVLERNPSLDAAREAWQAALSRVPQATALEDPMLSYSVAPLSITGQSRFGQAVELGQEIPFPGKRNLRGEVVQAEAAAARQVWESARLRLALMASQLFDDYFVVHRGLAINDEHLELLRTLKKSAEAQYVVGRASQADPLQAEVELSELLRQRLALESQRDTVRAQLNGLLHRPPHKPLPLPPQELPAPEGVLPLSDILQEEALRQRPELAGMRSRVGGGEAAVQLAKREYWPDFRIMGSYNSMWMDTPHQFMAGVSINIPLQRGKRKAAVEEAQAQLRSTRQEEARLVDDVRVEVEQARARFQEALEALKLYRGRVLPAARDQVAAARVGFESGRNNFQVVIDAERSLRSAKLRFEEALADVQRRQAELHRAVGRVPGLLSKGDL